MMPSTPSRVMYFFWIGFAPVWAEAAPANARTERSAGTASVRRVVQRRAFEATGVRFVTWILQEGAGVRREPRPHGPCVGRCTLDRDHASPAKVAPVRDFFLAAGRAEDESVH